jgi:hypothetical protein
MQVKKKNQRMIEKPRRKKRGEYKRHREMSVQTVNNERKMQIRQKRKHRLVNNPEKNTVKQEEKQNIKLIK